MILERIVKHRWFGFADLACASASIVLWELEPGWSPLLIALLPWFLRLSAGCFPFQRTRFELPLAIFLLTAAIGVWAAYSQEDARGKFWLLTGGILLYYALAGQPQDNLWTIAGFLSLIGVGTACYFLFTNDWQQYPAKIDLLNQVGLWWWMKVRPAFRVIRVHPNVAAGVMASATPFLVAIGVNAWKEKRILMGIWVLVGGSLISAGLLLATSRGASFALATGMGIWLLWVLSNRIQHSIPGRPKTIFSIGLVLLIIVTTGFAFLFPGGPIGLVNSIPGPSNTGSRLELADSALELVGDFPFTGGGLHSFPGLYSTYIRGIPHFITSHSHNLYLDIVLQQGILGMLAFCFVYLGSFWWVVTHDWKTPRALLVWASFTSLLIVVLHGLVDDHIYDRWGAAFVFFLPGIAYAMTRSSPKTKTQHPSPSPLVPGFTTGSRYRQSMIGAAVVAFVALLMLVYGYRQSLLAAWYADLGAVRMAQTELAGFPPATRPEGYNVAELEPAERLFLQSLRYNARNRTANHRLGLIALGRRDYPAAVFYLETAYQADKNHRGIWKALGYSYVWSGQFDQATALLVNIPEASYELRHYFEWWKSQGRDDLAERAEAVTKRLEALELPPPTGGPTVEPTPTATPSPTPETAWTGWVESNTTDPAAGGIGVLRVSVDGLVDLPVTIHTSAGWSATNWTGTNTEYGPYFCEFAPLPTETFTVIPEGLGVSVQVPLRGPGVAVVRFAQRPVSTPTPMGTSTATTSPQPAPTVSEPTPTELALDCCQCTALGSDQYVPSRKQPGYTCAESCFQGCLELGFSETVCELGQVGGYAVACPAAP